jgi:hypothetical protein
MSKRRSDFDRFMEMTDGQREAEVARFDAERLGTPGKPLTAAQKALHRRAARRRTAVNGAKTGNGSTRVQVTIERELLERADAYAKSHGTTRSDLIVKGLKVVIGKR